MQQKTNYGTPVRSEKEEKKVNNVINASKT